MSMDYSFLRKVLFVLLPLAGASGVASANTIHVCATCAHKTIQSAVTDSVNDDTISVAQGTYVENVTIVGKALHIVGGPGLTSVIATGEGPVFTLGATSVASGSNPVLIEISNLTISGGHHLNGSGEGGGIQVRPGAFLHLTNSIVTGNTAQSGGGISVRTLPGDPFQNQITRSFIQNNTAVVSASGGGGTGGGLALQQGDLLSEESSITWNQANDGAGVYESAGAHWLYISSNHIENNYALTGRGGGLSVASYLRMDFTDVSSNRAFGPEGAAGMYLAANVPAADLRVSGPDIENSVFSRSETTRGTAGGILITGNPSVPVSLTDVFVVLNGGYGILNKGSILELNLKVELNRDGNCVGGTGCP